MTTRAPLDGFETALLSELREHVTSRRPAPAPRRRRRIVAAGSALGAAVAITAGGLALRPDPAFAISPQADGDIVVTIHSLDDADGLERALRAQGIDADVDYSTDVPEPPPGAVTEEHAADKGSTSSGATFGSRTEGAAPPAGACDVPSTISVEQDGDDVTFRLSHDFVDSDAKIDITTMGSTDGPSAIAVGVEMPPGGC